MTGSEYSAEDLLTPTNWRSDLRDEIDSWAQGDLIAPLRLAWVGPVGEDPVTDVEVLDGVEADGREKQRVVDARSFFVAGIIVSQTCDVVTSGPGERHAFVQVCPVSLVDKSAIKNLDALQNGQVVDRFLLDPQPSVVESFAVDPSQLLIADLRISIPVSKAVLVTAQRVSGFQTEDDSLAFASHLAAKLYRPALNDSVIEAKNIIAAAFKADSKTDTFWWTQVDEVRVLCHPTRLAPTEVTVIVVHRLEPSARTVDRWKRVVQAAKRNLKSQGITLRHPLHTTVDKLLATQYRNSVRLDLPDLRPGGGA